MVAKELEEQALQLPPSDRAELARLLLASLDEGADGDAEQAWLAEAQRRAESYEDGRIDATPAEHAIRRARSGIR